VHDCLAWLAALPANLFVSFLRFTGSEVWFSVPDGPFPLGFFVSWCRLTAEALAKEVGEGGSWSKSSG
jgi:hypothetical protein